MSVDEDDVFAEWERDVDGYWTRRAARVIVADAAGRMLLLRGFDVNEPTRTWWFTPGGGVGPDETPRECAARELHEETGLHVAPDELTGPVAQRSAEFPYFGRQCRQHEVLFYAVLGSADVATSRDGWTDVERVSVSDLRWWSPRELAASQETVYPPALPALVEELTTSPWDGHIRVLT